VELHLTVLINYVDTLASLLHVLLPHDAMQSAVVSW